MVSSSNVNKEVTWNQIKAIKGSYDKHYSDCSLILLYDEDIMKNVQNFSHFLNISNISNKVKNLSTNINEAGEMFIYLNSCPIDTEKAIDYWDIFYTLNIIGKLTSSIMLTLLKTINYSSEDGRTIAKSILQKLLLEMKIEPNEFERLTQPEKYSFKVLKGLTGI